LTVIVYVPAGVVAIVAMVRVDAPGPLVLVIATLELENTGVMLTPVGPLAWRLTVPEKPLRLIRLTTDVPLVPVLTVKDVGVALAPKFGTGTVTVKVRLCVKRPTVPVTMML
jgi:hypothetical protein